MRNEQVMMDLIMSVAKADDRIRAVSMEGSRANPAVPKDKYQDYDMAVNHRLHFWTRITVTAFVR